MEILIAISIIAILTAIGIVSYASINRNARNAKRKSDIEQLRSAFELYRADNGYYPARHNAEMKTTSLATNILTNPVDPIFDTYLSSIPSDPKGFPYLYVVTDPNNGQFYGYCVAAMMEPIDMAPDTECSVGTSGYNYSRKNP